MTRVFCTAFVAITIAACSIGEANHITEVYPARKVSSVKVCDSGFQAVDLSTLEACGNGQGHCYPGDKVMATGLPACAKDGDVCVPDKMLSANGQKLKSCKFFTDGREGVCGSLLIGELAQNASLIPPSDECDKDNERCTPCVDPRDGSDTHVCDPTGAHVEACVGGAGKVEQTCCHNAGVCMLPTAAPEDQRDSLPHDSCGASKVCAPAALVDNNPTRCYVLGLPGVCLDICFAAILGPSKPVTNSDCRATEVCLPCVVGKGQGMPGC